MWIYLNLQNRRLGGLASFHSQNRGRHEDCLLDPWLYKQAFVGVRVKKVPSHLNMGTIFSPTWEAGAAMHAEIRFRDNSIPGGVQHGDRAWSIKQYSVFFIMPHLGSYADTHYLYVTNENFSAGKVLWRKLASANFFYSFLRFVISIIQCCLRQLGLCSLLHAFSISSFWEL